MPQIVVATDKLMAYRKTLFSSDASVPHYFSTSSQAFIPSAAIPHLSQVRTQFVERCFEIIFCSGARSSSDFRRSSFLDFPELF
jgi:hypothetical protein